MGEYNVYLCTGRPRVSCHALEHLRSANGRLPRQVALGQHLLARKEHLLGGNFNPVRYQAADIFEQKLLLAMVWAR